MAGKKYGMENLGIKALLGRKVLAASINDEKDLVVLDTDKGRLFLSWVGDCCAKCYIANFSGMDALVGGTILEAEHAEWKDFKRDEDYGDVIESMGTNIKTDKGHVSFESRLSHNGYYGGWIEVSDEEPVNQYSSPRFDTPEEWPELKALADF